MLRVTLYSIAMRSLFPLLLLAALALVLFLTNPEPDDFQEFAREQSGELFRGQLGAEVGEGPFGRILGSLAGDATAALVDRLAERDDYLVASVYTLDLDGPNSTEDEWRFLGIAGQFVELQRPASLESQGR
jgi:hypothetical protein